MATILLVDDDPLQAYTRKSVLESRFPNVQRVSDGAEALCLVEQPQFANHLGLVISGQHLPGLGGPAFVAELRSRMPGLPVLVLGNGSEAAEDYHSRANSIRFLPGPVTTQAMLIAANELLTQCENTAAA